MNLSQVRRWVIASVVGAGLATFISMLAAQPATQPMRSVRIGVYDSRSVAVAAIRSGANDPKIQQLQAQLKEAEAAGNTQRAEQIKKRGSQLQTLRHMQGFSIAPIDDLLEPVRDKLPPIAREAGVDVIIPRTDFASANVQTVDVTDAMVKLFNPDARTLQTVTELRKNKPIGLADALAIEN